MEYIDLKKLNLDELVGVVNIYPWFGGARKELCLRMSGMGESGWNETQTADAALYIADRRKLADIMRRRESSDLTDADVERLLKSYLSEKDAAEDDRGGKRRTHVIGGDYFTQADYDQVRRSDDNVFSRYAAKAKKDHIYEDTGTSEFDMYTETLAQIYLEQGYPEQARNIYSKLLLANPEKNAYFAALIQKIDELNNY